MCLSHTLKGLYLINPGQENATRGKQRNNKTRRNYQRLLKRKRHMRRKCKVKQGNINTQSVNKNQEESFNVSQGIPLNLFHSGLNNIQYYHTPEA